MDNKCVFWEHMEWQNPCHVLIKMLSFVGEFWMISRKLNKSWVCKYFVISSDESLKKGGI